MRNNNTLYIPKKIHAGFQERTDTYNGNLSYIIYTDDKGVKRKETSWESWRDKKITPEDYDNEPKSGFVLHKDVKRYNWSSFSSKRTLIRVFDPRGMEFEITTDNLLFILQHTDCVKRELVGEFVYAWYGPELILLPKDTEEYRQSCNFTELQAKKISAKDLVAGRSYKTKDQSDLIYLGYHFWHSFGNAAFSYYDGRDCKERKTKKYHIFAQQTNGKTSFLNKSSVEFLAIENSEDIVPNFAELVEEFNHITNSSKIVSLSVKSVPFDCTPHPTYNWEYSEYLKREIYFIIKDDIVTELHFRKVLRHEKLDNGNGYGYVFKGYSFSKTYAFNIKTHKFMASNLGDGDTHILSEADINKLGVGDLYVTLENGNAVKVDKLYNI